MRWGEGGGGVKIPIISKFVGAGGIGVEVEVGGS